MYRRSYPLTLLLLSVTPAILQGALTVAPSQVTVTNNQPVFTIAGAGTSGVKWSLVPNVGTITTTPSQATYVPPAGTIARTVHLIATDVLTPAHTATAVISLTATGTGVSVQPATVHLIGPANQQFTATVTGTANAAVKWSLNPAIGSISAAGDYSAPAVAAATAVSVTATSVADPTKTSTAAVQLAPGIPIKFTTGNNGLTSIKFNGVEFNYLYGEGLLSYATTTPPGGYSVFTTPACDAGSFTPTVVTHTCTANGIPINYTVTYSSPDTATINALIQITNNSPTDTLSMAEFSTIGIRMASYNEAQSHTLALDGTNPVSYVNYGTGQWAVWNNNPTSDITMGVTCGPNICKNQPMINTIAPGQTKTASFSLRFNSDTTIQTIDLVPEAYTEFAAVYPPLVNWPDRRPIMAWFISDYTKRSPINPRGYLQNPNLDVSNIPGFGAQVLAEAQNIITQMKARPVQPQGLIIWDLEGQEFIQSTTYVGDPRVLSEGYAPEMDAVADQVFALFANAGYKTGVTLRPQQLQWGPQLPATCPYGATNDYRGYFIKTGAPYLQSFYACYDPNGINWSLIPQGNGGQTSYLPTQSANVTALLIAKATYAHTRWGTTLFYVDSTVWPGGAVLPADIFRSLQAALPDSIFIPEESYVQTIGTAMPFDDPNNAGAPKFAPVTWRYVYPNGGMGVFLAHCQGACWATNYNNFITGQRIGDMPIYPQPTQLASWQLQAMENMILDARSQMSSITVTDTSTGANYSYSGAADTVYQYPVKMRVYFGATAAQVATSNVYCESGQWFGTNTCSINLANLVVAQTRYYDFAGNLVLAEAPGPR